MLVREARASISTRRRLKLHSKKFPWLAIKMRRYALVGVLVAALSCARQATAWDDTYASPRIRAQVGAVRARTRLAVRLQRAWRRRRDAQVAPV